jgi:hypothetical protein
MAHTILTQEQLRNEWSTFTQQENWPEGLNRQKGFILIGNPGVGKTYFMKAFHEHRKPNRRRGWELDHFSLNTQVRQLGSINLQYYDHDFYLDDFGADVKTVTVYGTPTEPIVDLISGRYDKWQNAMMGIGELRLSFISTNLTPDHFVNVYGERIWSRIQEMCNVIFITGENLRK